MARMETSLADYHDKYGVEISNVLVLKSAKLNFDKLPVPLDELSIWVDGLSESMAEALSEILSDVMEIAGVLDERFAELLELPTTVAEYVEKKPPRFYKTSWKNEYRRIRNLIINCATKFLLAITITTFPN